MCHLTVLDVSGNQLTLVHDVHYLKCLVELILDNNEVNKVQADITKLLKLRLLSAKNNRILDRLQTLFIGLPVLYGEVDSYGHYNEVVLPMRWLLHKDFNPELVP